ncbi:MAG: hypothetical protein LBH36_02830 [Candidatus Nomurabacteria bacterium]|jgi:hypothetical protein|nr:hypothetical protein [Candidatus Nomurabacteria bacterium]
MEYERLDERVVVLAIFEIGAHSCRPLKFKRKSGREVTITEVGLVHPKNDGLKTRHIFDVTDGTADYRLEFDSETLVWRLTAEGDRYE